MKNFYDFQIGDNVILYSGHDFDSVNEVYAHAILVGASHVRQNHRDCTPWMRQVVGECGEWMDMSTFESAVYEYNNTRI